MIRQNILRFAPAVAFLMMGTAIAAPGKGASCADVPIRVTMYSVADPTGINRPSNISSDGKGEYINKADGVSALIKVCDGTNSTVWTTGSKRRFSFNFPLPIPGSTDQAPFAGKGAFLASGWINVHNITFNYITADGAYQPFRTRMGLSFTVNRTSYGMGFFPPDTDLDAPDTHAPSPDLISVYDSPAKVYPQAMSCTAPDGTPKPSSWLVKGNNPNINSYMQVGTLGYGMYEMPFEFLIEALKCY